MTTLRALPITVPPLPGEALDSWFEAIAYRFRTPLSDLLPAFGLARRVEAGDCRRDIPARWAILLRDHEAVGISHVTGVTVEVLHAMTLAHFDGRAPTVNRETRQISRWHHFLQSARCDGDPQQGFGADAQPGQVDLVRESEDLGRPPVPPSGDGR
ncbi:hypothetical protein BFF78_41510 [Streptomyces fodineus]|uniref:TniQ domain-containing protein n=1 Tax=Streptomyces fodineus TaxID=1904616 RepID=A0A1D7YM67_9ACTN|nr:hypothetical protein BFF78_41510 [Streptomyces fodineus]